LIEVSTQICDGLAAAHTAGVTHRDLKPGNIMLTRDGRVKILDFGLARQDRAHGEDSTTIEASHPGVILGTPGYMSPEQVRGDATDARSDIFSLGVILYEMASGKRAFTGGSSVEVMNSILKDEPPELPPASPPALDRIVRRCIEKQPERRFQSAADLGFALRSMSSSPKGEWRLKRRPWLKWAAVLAIGMISGAVYWFGVRPRRPSSPTTYALLRLTYSPGLTADAAVSPDGKLMAYVRDGDIWVQQVDGSVPIRITNDPEGNSDPAFSQDGREVAFRAEREGGGGYIAPALGGEARELVPEGRRPRFSPDGRWLMYLVRPNTFEDMRDVRLFVRPISGGTPTQIGARCGVAEETPVWSPEGSRILFGGQCPNDALVIWVSTVDGKSVKSCHRLYAIRVDQWIGNPPRLLSRRRYGREDANYITAVPVSEDGTKITGPDQKLASVTDSVDRISAATDGRVVVSVSANRQHLWRLPLDEKGHAAGEAKQLTNGPSSELCPSLSKDGGKLAFISMRGVLHRPFYRDLSTGRDKELTTDGDSYGNAVFGADGEGIAFARSAAYQKASIYYVPLSGGLPRKIWDKSPWSSSWDWSPDGKTLLIYTREDFSKPLKGFIRQLDLDTSSTTTFLDDPELNLWEGNFSHDGRWVTFNAVTKDGKTSRIFVAPFRKALVPRSEWIPITQGKWDGKPRFSSGDKLIFFLQGLDGPRSLRAQKLRGEMRPEGEPLQLYPPGNSQRSDIAWDEIGAGPGLIMFSRSEVTGNI
jgi:Tol biopolymer transport system component